MGNGRKAGELWVGLGNGNAEVDPFGYIEKTGNLGSDRLPKCFHRRIGAGMQQTGYW